MGDLACSSRRSPRLPATSIGPRLVVAVVALSLGVAVWLPISPAMAESPVALSEELADDGVYVSRVRTEIDEEALEAAVQEVRFDGLRLVAVAPIDPQPDGEAFARRIQEAVDSDAAIIFMPDGTLETFVIDELAPARIRATEKARAIADPARATLAFAEELTSVRVAEQPALVGRLIRWLILLGLTIGGVVAIEQAIAANRRRRAEQKVTA